MSFATCQLNSCNFGQHRYFILFYLGKHSQEVPKKLGRLVINYFMPKLLVTYGNPSLSLRRPTSANSTRMFTIPRFLMVAIN